MPALIAARGGRLPSRLLYFSTISSTNDAALRLAAVGAGDGLTLVADTQQAGRGRVGRTWFSPPGAGLYVSVLFRFSRSAPPIPLGEPAGPSASMLTLAAGVALAEGLRTACGLRVEIKWPNDLMIGRRKLGGILAEASGTGGDLEFVVIGFGINLRATAYPHEIADRATSLEAELGRPVDRAMVLVESLLALERRRLDLSSGRVPDVLDAWLALAPASRGAAVEWRTASGVSNGVTEGIDEQGALLVRTGRGIERVIAGEVRWL